MHPLSCTASKHAPECMQPSLLFQDCLQAAHALLSTKRCKCTGGLAHEHKQFCTG